MLKQRLPITLQKGSNLSHFLFLFYFDNVFISSDLSHHYSSVLDKLCPSQMGFALVPQKT